MSFIKEYLFEINEYPKTPVEDGQLLTIKDYFYHDSSVEEYGYRATVVPVSCILNKEEIPDEATIRSFINNSKPVIKRSVDSSKQLEYWSYHPIKLEEIKND